MTAVQTPVEGAVTTKGNEEIKEMIDAGDVAGIEAYALQQLAAWTKDPEALPVQHGDGTVHSTFCGNLTEAKAFKLMQAFNCGNRRVDTWESPRAVFKPGHIVRSMNADGTASLHLILSEVHNEHAKGYQPQDAKGYSVCIQRNYKGGVGRGGKNTRPVWSDVIFA